MESYKILQGTLRVDLATVHALSETFDMELTGAAVRVAQPFGTNWNFWCFGSGLLGTSEERGVKTHGVVSVLSFPLQVREIGAVCIAGDLPWAAADKDSVWNQFLSIVVHPFFSLLFFSMQSTVDSVPCRMAFRALLVFVMLWLPISGQVYFNQPTAGEIINGGVPFAVSVTESYSAPYFSQMTNFSLLLLAGTYSSPVSLLSLT